MNKKTMLFALLALAVFACKKPGEGGDATIRGYVHVEDWNSSFTHKTDEFPAKDEDVFIIYGDRDFGYDDRTRTDFQGRFQFDFLYEGDYRIYVYSRDSADADGSGEKAIVREVNISSRKELIELDTIRIFY